MGRRSSRRMWHAVAAFVPLPLIGMGYVLATSNKLATEVELYLTAPEAIYTATRTADASAAPREISGEAAKLFTTGVKGPRADHYAAAQDDAGKQLITASLTGGAGLAKVVAGALAATPRPIACCPPRPRSPSRFRRGGVPTIRSS